MSTSSSSSAPPDPQESSVDRISTLPDTVLSHILSFLLSKDAVATSVLSSRWKFLSRYTSNLTFCYSPKPLYDSYIYGDKSNSLRFMNFVNFVTRTLLVHDLKCIDKFRFDISKGNVMYDCHIKELIRSWVAAAVARNVKVIVIAGCQRTSASGSDLRFDLPSCTYTCKSLHVLHLRRVVMLNSVVLVSLPNLRTLHLEEVRIPSDESLSKLLSGCSSLKSLYVLRGCDDGVVTFTVCSQTLEHLTITTLGRDVYYNKDEEKYVNLQLDVPALKYLHVHDTMLQNISMEEMPSLLEAKINLCKQFFENQLECNWTGIDNIFRAFCLVKLLTLDEFILMALRHSGLSPRFRGLTNLTLETGCCNWSSLQDFLEGSDSLEYLTLNMNFNQQHTNETCWIEPKETPACLSCLKEILVDGLTGFSDELAMLGYILEHARLLKTMKITVSSHLKLRAGYHLLQKLLKIRRLSNMCQVIISE